MTPAVHAEWKKAEEIRLVKEEIRQRNFEDRTRERANEAHTNQLLVNLRSVQGREEALLRMFLADIEAGEQKFADAIRDVGFGFLLPVQAEIVATKSALTNAALAAANGALVNLGDLKRRAGDLMARMNDAIIRVAVEEEHARQISSAADRERQL